MGKNKELDKHEDHYFHVSHQTMRNWGTLAITVIWSVPYWLISKIVYMDCNSYIEAFGYGALMMFLWIVLIVITVMFRELSIEGM